MRLYRGPVLLRGLPLAVGAVSAIDTTTSLEQAVDEAMSRELPCEAGTPRGCHGNNPARWYAIRSCACPVDTWCDPDRSLALALEAALDGLICQRCNVRVTVRWEPIR